jgi:hypothetical protein
VALFLPDVPCPLCGEGVSEHDEIVATSHFMSDPADPLYPFSDAVMHRRCFATWAQRRAFVAAYNASGLTSRMRPDGTIVERDILTRVLSWVLPVAAWILRLTGRLR